MLLLELGLELGLLLVARVFDKSETDESFSDSNIADND